MPRIRPFFICDKALWRAQRHIKQQQRCITSAYLRQQMLNDAIAELNKVKEHFQSTIDDDANFLNKTPSILESPVDVANFLQKFDTVMFDCDGVLYRSPHPTPDAAMALKSLIFQRKRVMFVTNNGAVSRPQLREKITMFLELDDDLLTDDMMVGSAYSCAQYLQRRNPSNSDSDSRCRKVFCIGSEGLCSELERSGFTVVHANDEANSFMSRDDLAGYDFKALLNSEESVDIDAVVIGHDTDFTYRKLSIATVLLQWNPQALFVATNLDAYDLTGSDGRHIPGNGALVKAVEFASHRRAINVGKPSQTLLQLLKSSNPTLAEQRTVMVGDRLDTDIRFGVDHGMSSLLVLTGVTNAKELRRVGLGTVEEPLPTAIMSHVGAMAFDCYNF